MKECSERDKGTKKGLFLMMRIDHSDPWLVLSRIFSIVSL